MGYVTSEGVRIHYEVEGIGPTLVLQHGFTQSLEDWRLYGYVAALAPSHQLVMIDARGHGMSDKPYDSQAYSQQLYVADIVAVLDTLGLERAHYCGYSMGGWIGFGMAEFARHRLHGLIIGGQHAYGRPAPPKPDGNDPVNFFTTFFRRIGLDFEALSVGERKRWLMNDTRALALSMGARQSQESLLPTMAMPCLLYAGDADGVFEQARRSANAIAGATFVTLPRLNHGDAFEKSDLVVPKMLEFLRRAGTA